MPRNEIHSASTTVGLSRGPTHKSEPMSDVLFSTAGVSARVYAHGDERMSSAVDPHLSRTNVVSG